MDASLVGFRGLAPGKAISMTDLRTREPARTRTVEPEAHVEAPASPHYLTAAAGIAGLLVLLGLFAVAGTGSLHGFWWALFAIPAVLLAGAAWSLVERALSARR
jgi:hypothetical protein